MHACPGYGARRPRDCALSAWLVACEVIWGQLLDAITLGIIFARIAHPKNRARTVFISDCAVIARRDAALKFMFRVADVRQTQARVLACAWRPSSLGEPATSLLGTQRVQRPPTCSLPNHACLPCKHPLTYRHNLLKHFTGARGYFRTPGNGWCCGPCSGKSYRCMHAARYKTALNHKQRPPK